MKLISHPPLFPFSPLARTPTDTDDPSDGHITDEQIVKQVAVLNADYMGIFEFNLVGNTTTTNQEWFEQASSYEEGKPAQSVLHPLRTLSSGSRTES